MKLVIRWTILAGSFWVTTLIVSGIQIKSGAWNYFWVAALFGIINTLLGSILKLFTLPALILTFGLFAFVINAAMLMLTDRWSDVITIDRFTSALIATSVVGVPDEITDAAISLEHLGRHNGQPGEAHRNAQAGEHIGDCGRNHDVADVIALAQPQHASHIRVILRNFADAHGRIDDDRPDRRDEDHEDR